MIKNKTKYGIVYEYDSFVKKYKLPNSDIWVYDPKDFSDHKVFLYYFDEKMDNDDFIEYVKNMNKAHPLYKSYKYSNKEYINDSNKAHRELQKLNKENMILKKKYNILSSFIRNCICRCNLPNNVDVLGCSIEYFKEYIEEQFEDWMSWDNYGNWNGSPSHNTLNHTSWDIDHIVPVSSVNTVDELIELNHYTNFQPLCSYNNRYIKRDNL